MKNILLKFWLTVSGLVIGFTSYAQWQDVSGVSISGDVLTCTSYLNSYIRTSSTFNKSSGGYFEAKWLPNDSHSLLRYIGLSEPGASASSYSSMVYRFDWSPSINHVKIMAHGSQVATLSYPFNNPTPTFRITIENQQVKFFVDGILRYTYTNSGNVPTNLKGHIIFHSEPDAVQASFLAFPPPPPPPAGGGSSPSEPVEDIYWMNTHDVTINANGSEVTSTDYSSAYAMTADPINTTVGGTYTIDVVDASYDDIWIGLTDNTNSTNSSSTMDFKFNYESSFQDIIAYVGGSSVYSNSNGPQLAEFQFVIEPDRIKYIVDNTLVYTYNGAIPNELYLHIIFTDPDKVKVTVEHTSTTSAGGSVWSANDSMAFINGKTVLIGSGAPNNPVALDVNGQIKAIGGNSVQWNEAYNQRISQVVGPGLVWQDSVVTIDSAYMNISHSTSNSLQDNIVNLIDNFSGIASAEGYNGSSLPSNAFDGNMDSKWSDNDGVTFLQYNFDDGRIFSLKSYNLRVPYSFYAPVNWTIYGSINGTSWDIIDIRTGISWSNGQTRQFELAELSNAYNKFRLFIDLNGGSSYTEISELSFFGVHEEPPVNFSVRNELGFQVVNLTDEYPGNSSAEGYYSSYSHTNAFDNNTSSTWYDREEASFLQYNFSNNKKLMLTSYQIIRNGSNYSPTSWTVYGSNDGSIWDVLDYQSAPNWSNPVFGIEKIEKAYNRFRVFFHGATGYRLQIREIDFFGHEEVDIPVTPWIINANSSLINYETGVSAYDNNESKSWLISPNDGGEAILKFENFEAKNPTDILNIYDGDDFNAPLISSLRASDLAQEIRSSGNALYIEYLTVSGQVSGNGSGFRINYVSSNIEDAIFPWLKIEDIGYALQDRKLAVNSTNVHTDHDFYVDGSIGAEEIVIEVVNPPDYVFETGYDLKSLDFIKDYIAKEGHLPEVPSAKEMELNGVSLGEMNMILLKKIEELTLLMIKQEEEIKKLKESLK